MPDSLANILCEPDDARLCDRLFCRIAERRGNEFYVEGVPAEEAVVALVWHANGIIGNGGFYYLLEGDFPDDPGFSRTVQALRTIGCDSAAEAFDEVLACFPGRRPDKDIERRLR